MVLIDHYVLSNVFKVNKKANKEMGSKKYLLFILPLLLIISIAVLGYFTAVPGLKEGVETYPKIGITPQSFDFGELKYGSIAEYTFKVKNLGLEILMIGKLATSCACTSAQIEKVSILPGEEVDLLIKYNTGAMNGSHGRGSQDRIIFIKSNDPINPQIEVTIHANVK